MAVSFLAVRLPSSLICSSRAVDLTRGWCLMMCSVRSDIVCAHSFSVVMLSVMQH